MDTVNIETKPIAVKYQRQSVRVVMGRVLAGDATLARSH